MKYRIKHIDMVGYFAQVKKSWFSGWKTIGVHSIGLGEYDEDHLDYPLNQQCDAVLLCHRHADFVGAKRFHELQRYYALGYHANHRRIL